MDTLRDLSIALSGDVSHESEPMDTCFDVDTISEFVLPENAPPDQAVRILASALNVTLRAVQSLSKTLQTQKKPTSDLDRTLIAFHQKPKVWEEFVKTDDFACLSSYLDNHVRVYLERINANAASGTDLAASFFPLELTTAWRSAQQSGTFIKRGMTAPATYSNSWADFKELVLSTVPHVDPAPLQLHAFMAKIGRAHV